MGPGMYNLMYINGEYKNQNEVCISFQDRGFQFGDGVYEVIRVIRGQAIAVYRHLDRLANSAAAIQIPLPLEQEQILNVIRRLIAAESVNDGLIYMQLTRGAAPRSHGFPRGVSPTFLAYPMPWLHVPAKAFDKGGTAIIVPDDRWCNCHIKSLNLLPNVLAKEKAAAAGADEALFERSGHEVLEGTASNLFAVHGRTVTTPPANRYILPGITRSIILELARSCGLEVREEPISRESLFSASEVFITNRGLEVLPILKVDGCQIGTGRPGPVTKLLFEAYTRLVNNSDDLEKI